MWREIVSRDAVLIGEEFTRWFGRFVFPEGMLVRFELGTEKRATPDEVFDTAAKARQAGYRFTKEYLETETGAELEADAENLPGASGAPGGGSSPVPAGRFPLLNKEPAKPLQGREDESALEAAIAEKMAKAYGEALKESRAEAEANKTDANGAEHAPEGSANGGQFVGKGAGGASAPSGTTEARIRAVKSSPKADAQARSLGYSDINDMMARAETVEAERVSAIQEGFSGKCKAHEAVAVISANRPFKDAEGNTVDFGGDILEHYIEGRRRRDNEPKVGNLEDLPYAIKAVKSDTYGVTRLKYPRGATPDPINPPRGTQREYHLPTERGQMKVFVYIQGGHINGWHVEQ